MAKMRAGIMGWPVAHSLSPKLHSYWLAQYGIDGEYVPLPVKPEDLKKAIRGLVKKGFRGVNLTIPHKEAALTLLDEVDDAARPSARSIRLLLRMENCAARIPTPMDLPKI